MGLLTAVGLRESKKKKAAKEAARQEALEAKARVKTAAAAATQHKSAAERRRLEEQESEDLVEALIAREMALAEEEDARAAAAAAEVAAPHTSREQSAATEGAAPQIPRGQGIPAEMAHDQSVTAEAAPQTPRRRSAAHPANETRLESGSQRSEGGHERNNSSHRSQRTSEARPLNEAEPVPEQLVEAQHKAATGVQAIVRRNLAMAGVRDTKAKAAAKAKAEEEARAREAKAKQEAEARAQAETKAKEAEAMAKVEAEAQARAEAAAAEAAAAEAGAAAAAEAAAAAKVRAAQDAEETKVRAAATAAAAVQLVEEEAEEAEEAEVLNTPLSEVSVRTEDSDVFGSGHVASGKLVGASTAEDAPSPKSEQAAPRSYVSRNSSISSIASEDVDEATPRTVGAAPAPASTTASGCFGRCLPPLRGSTSTREAPPKAAAPASYSYETPAAADEKAEAPGSWADPLLYFFRRFQREPPADQREQLSPHHAFLLFSEANGGCFQLQWATEQIDGALGRFTPRSPVPEFKLTANGGLSELCRGIGGPNVKSFYRGWVSFIKLARQYEAEFCFLANLPKQPVALYLATSGLSIKRLQEGEAISFDGVRAAAAVGIHAEGLDVLNMETQLFLSVGQKLGFSMALEGGAAGLGGVADAIVELSSDRTRRASFAEEKIAAARAFSEPEKECVQLSPAKMRRLSQSEQERAAERAAQAEQRAIEKAGEEALASPRWLGSSSTSPRASMPEESSTTGVPGTPRLASPLVGSPRGVSSRFLNLDEMQTRQAEMAASREAAAMQEEKEREAVAAAEATRLAGEQARAEREEAKRQRAAINAETWEKRAQLLRSISQCLKCAAKEEPPAEEPPSPALAFLVFSEANGGCFELHWSTTPVEGALASFLPKVPVPETKLTTNCGRSELCRGIGGPNVKEFQRGWVSYIKLACQQDATLFFLSNLEQQPVALYFATVGLSVTRLREGNSISFAGVRAVAAVRLNSEDLNVGSLETQFFLTVGMRIGFAMALEGGPAGLGGVADTKVELNTDRTRRPSVSTLGSPRTASARGVSTFSIDSDDCQDDGLKEVASPRSSRLSGWMQGFFKPAKPEPPTQPALPQGHLLFSETNGGCFQLQWSVDLVEGALASFRPKKPVPDFKLKASGGRTELCRDIGGPNIKNFYRGWVSYIKLARQYEAQFTFVSNLEKQPVALYFATEGLAVKKLELGETMPFDGVRAVAAVGLKAAGLNVRSMETQFFLSVGAKLGASYSFVEAAPQLESPRLRAVSRTPVEGSPTLNPEKRQSIAAIERAESRLRV